MTILINFFFSLLFVISLSPLNAISPSTKQVFVGAIIEDHDQLIPYFLKSIDKLEYDKKMMILQLSVCNSSKEVQTLVSNWAKSHEGQYQKIILSEPTLLFEASQLEENKLHAKIKDEYLETSQKFGCSHCFILSSDVYLLPHTLKFLIRKNKPILAPLLRPFPEPNDANSNFFADISEDGYYKDHPLYMQIAIRDYKGTFKVPCVHGAYLIQTRFADKLSFSKHLRDWEFLSFSNNARKKNVDQFICNEKEFGFRLHFYKDPSKEELKSFSLVNPEAEMNPSLANTLLSDYAVNDPSIKKRLEKFNHQDYAIFRVGNKNLFYLDDVTDYIKSYNLKRNNHWENHIKKEFKKHVIPGTIALDIGGHIGTQTLNLSKLVGDQGTVHVFEPQSKLFCELVINMHLNNRKNIIFHHNALGSEEKWIEMHIPKEAWTARISPDLINEGHGSINEIQDYSTGDSAKMIKLDDLNLKNISFMKIDVEGFEMEVIKGGLETIKANKPTMIIEIFNDSKKSDKISEITNLGYSFSSLGGDDYLFIPLTKNEEK